jgi:2-methylcitrate dehydratase PrpD
MTATPTLLERLSEFAARVSYSTLPSTVTSGIKHHIFDTIGVCVAAAKLDTSQMAADMARIWGGPEEATMIGFNGRLPATGAAFVNGTLAHSLEFDDTHLPSVLHPSASIVPTVMAVGEAVGASGKEMIAAAAAGYEVCIRTGMAGYDRALGNSTFFERGWHATSICGTLAAAVVAAKLYGLDAGGIGNAFGIAVSMGSGVIEGNRTGSSVKRLHCGWAAHAGIVAAQAARAGFTGPKSALEGRFGFYQAFCSGVFDEAEIVRGLGDYWSVPEIFYKPYPANHFTHAAIDASLNLRKRVAVADIEEIEVGVPAPVLRTIAEPAAEKARPRSGYQAQFSAPFVVAAAFLGGGGLGVWLDDFTDEKVSDPRYLALAAKVRCVANAECNAIFPNQFPSVLRLRTRSGEVLEEKSLVNRGGPGNPLSLDELKVKFMANCGRSLSEDSSLVLAEAIVNMEDRSGNELLNSAGQPRDLGALQFESENK